MSALLHALRFYADRIRDLRVLIIVGTLAVAIPGIIDYFTARSYKGGPGSILIFPAIFGIGLFLLCMLVLALELYGKRLSIRRYGELNKEEAAEFHAKIADKWLDREKA